MPIRVGDSDRAEQVRKWAYENAFTLIFMTALAVLTWTIIVATNYVFS